MSVIQAMHNGHSSQGTDWHTASVQEFFSAISWTGEAPKRSWTQSTPHDETTNALDTSLSVKEFFSHFPWDGEPHIAVAMEPLEVQPDLPLPEDELNLDDFADLF